MLAQTRINALRGGILGGALEALRELDEFREATSDDAIVRLARRWHAEMYASLTSPGKGREATAAAAAISTRREEAEAEADARCDAKSCDEAEASTKSTNETSASFSAMGRADLEESYECERESGGAAGDAKSSHGERVGEDESEWLRHVEDMTFQTMQRSALEADCKVAVALQASLDEQDALAGVRRAEQARRDSAVAMGLAFDDAKATAQRRTSERRSAKDDDSGDDALLARRLQVAADRASHRDRVATRRHYIL